MPSPKVSILMLTHNAPEYVTLAIESLHRFTQSSDWELIVVDNASDLATRLVVARAVEKGLVHRAQFNERNVLFAAGNNQAAEIASESAGYFLLLNSDVEIKSADWLDRLLDGHRRGISAFGMAEDPLRVDGYCLLIDADLYRRYQLDEAFAWWWGVTKLQARVLSDGYSVRGFYSHQRYLHHYGGRSGSAFERAQGMAISRDEVSSWFGGRRPSVVDPHRRLAIRLGQRVRRLV